MLRTLAWPGDRRANRVQGRVAEYREFQDGELIGGTRYRVLRLIGVGGMGTVYEVEHVELGKRFVLKALLRELSRRQDLVIRLRNEWRALGRLEHPNIVTVTDAGTSESGVPFYVMERLEGETLSVKMRRTRRFPVKEAVDIAAGVLEGLAAAHQISVVHRDVKPPNIFVLADGRPKVLDFGVAKIVDDPGVVTARGVAVGTPRYMSPEQARGETVDGRADIYSAGLILFETMTGVSPFDDARDANELILAHLAKRPPPLSSLAMGVPPELDVLVASMLGKDREERPASALEAARRLREISATSTRASRTPPPLVLATPVGDGGGTSTPEVDTTRPDGVASKPRLTHTSVTSTEPLSWLEKPTLRQLLPNEGTSAGSGSWPRGAADTLIGLPPGVLTGAPTEMPTSNGASVQSEGRVKTEIFTAMPAPEADVTHTRYPSPSPSSSLTPKARAPLASETPPPVTPTKELRAEASPRQRKAGGTIVWFGLGLLALAVFVGFVLVGRSTGRTLDAVSTGVKADRSPAAALTLTRAARAVPRPPPTVAAAPSAAAQRPVAPIAPSVPLKEESAAPLPSARPLTSAPKTGAKSRTKTHVDAATTAVPPETKARPVASEEKPGKSPPSGLPGSGL
jgi:serine/threonine protein kinase